MSLFDGRRFMDVVYTSHVPDIILLFNTQRISNWSNGDYRPTVRLLKIL